MKTKVLLMTAMFIGGLLFSSCQKDNALYEGNAIENSNMKDKCIDDSDAILADEIRNYPDSFNRFTTIQYHLKRASWVTLSVSPLNPEMNKIILVDKFQREGRQLVKFDASGLPSGKYLAELKIGSVVYQEVMTKVDYMPTDNKGAY